MFARLHLRRSTITALLVALAMVATMSTAFAAGGPPAGAGGGGGGTGGRGGGPGTETATNNLSVPTIMVNGSFTNVTCGTADVPSTLATPDGQVAYTGYPINPGAYYYVQGLNTWQAQCYNAAAASATAAWGDNLTGDAKLSTSSPIRVELGLMNSDTAAPSMQGYTVEKLNPDALDRESAYGTLALSSTGPASPATFAATQQRVYDGGAKFSIHNDTANSYVVPVGTAASAEINATGNVVYGYNLKVSAAGQYTITFNIPTVSVTGTDAGTVVDTHTVSLTITVTGGTGGGGGGSGSGGNG